MFIALGLVINTEIVYRLRENLPAKEKKFVFSFAVSMIPIWLIRNAHLTLFKKRLLSITFKNLSHN